MQKITPFLWFEKDMKKITDFYLSVFPGSKIKSSGGLDHTPSGHVSTATIEIYGLDFSLMTAGPYLPFKPTVSFIISCDSADEVKTLWARLSATGKILMELSAYPFAEKFGWVQDQYGVSWQIMFSSQMKSPQKVVPTMMFSGRVCGRAEEAVNFYTSVFRNSKINYLTKYKPEDIHKTEPKAVVKHAGFTLENCYMALMDSGRPSPLSFEQAISFIVSCDTQEEVDYYWAKLTDEGKEVQCGWLNDRFGFPWQVVPTRLGEMLGNGSPEQVARVTEAFMKMVKFDMKKLEEAYKGRI